MIDLYRERQWIPAWALALVGANGVVGAAILVSQGDQGRAAGGTIIGVMSAIVLLFGVMTTEVREDHLFVQFGIVPSYRKRIPLAGIERLDPCRYSPLREFGGWGIRGLGRSRALTARGSLGVRIRMRDGREWLVGSGDPSALAAAITEALRAMAA